MIHVALVSLGLAASAQAAPHGAEGPQKMVVGIGQQTVLTLPGLTRVAVGDPNVADVHVQGNGEVLILGKTAGHTTIIFWKGEQRDLREVEVGNDHTGDLDQLVHSLAGMEDVKVEKVGDKVVLQGTVPTDADLDKLNLLLKDEGNVANLVKVEREARRVEVEQINAALQKAGFRHAHASLVGSSIFLEGQVEDEADLKRAELIANVVAGNNPGAKP
jgi:pilus assembly protein CpaC